MPSPRLPVVPLACALLGCGLPGLLPADDHVMVIALADQNYTREKFADGKAKPETYVVMPGNFFGGNTVDRTLEKMPFRKIAGHLAFELAKREYWPAASAHQADLLMVVHWGVTAPRASMQEMTGRTSLSTDTTNTQDGIAAALGGQAGDVGWEVAERSNLNAIYADDFMNQQVDANSAEADRQNIARLLGLATSLKRSQEAFVPSVNDIAVQHSLKEERYFVIVKVYDLRKWEKGKVNQSIWTIRLNIGAPGKNFEQALVRMSRVGVDWFGRTTDDVVVVRQKQFKGTVEMPPVIILGEEK
ncbi:hypothetical protein ESB00_09745 [Oleiharenicola lentus]|uniref:Uncharacterized protein n=1 Tax=Oleiharenicola lentus TaxID=2508720 RepID=A0A4Q1CAQ9_9BACT|nr:hypothetical protein [Oleiharenicola lentus]RXK56134.1 hypothetical protein ESB00_09745 [Oleiharenicola lentus]